MSEHSMDPALAFFFAERPIRQCRILGGGNINDTWLIALADGSQYVLQRLHPAVFTNPDAVMHNLRQTTKHLHRASQPHSFVSFQLLTNAQGQDTYRDEQGGYWRVLSYIQGSRTLAQLQTAQQAGEVGRLLGTFHRLMAEMDPLDFHDPLPDFHITPRYLDHYDQLIAQAKITSQEEEACCRAIEHYRPEASLLEDARPHLRWQLIHGDPKAANFLFAQDTDQAISLIDLDTVKPGLLLHDLGDCLRSCCNLGGEEAQDATCVPERVVALVTAYQHSAGNLIKAADQELLVSAAQLITYELGLRFFTDYLAGDQYFKIQRPKHNLYRALNQFQLHRSWKNQETSLRRLLNL